MSHSFPKNFFNLETLFPCKGLNQRLIVLHILILCLLVLLPKTAYAVYFKHPYFPPEAVYRHHYQDTLRFPGPVNLNVASLEELKTLPEVDDNVGLKLIRIRPLNNYQDLYKLPYLSKQRVTRLIEKIKPLSQF